MLKQLLLLSFFVFSSGMICAQQGETIESHDNLQTTFNQTVRIPLRVKNTTDKPQFYVIRKSKGDLGDTQKGYFCLNNHCLDASIEEFSKRIEPGETLFELYYTLESGIQSGQTSLKFEYFPKGNAQAAQEKNVTVVVEERPTRTYVFQSKEITMYDIYPNPIQFQAFIDYKLHNESVKAKIMIHNILGKNMGEYELTVAETRLKIEADDLLPGVYFYTLYLDNNGILTRKLIVRK
ncbi:MAG: T9SS type A sorting domain-containing protein [Bacteroidetes bacterium]|nr:T9SS type A sorting domain-containing protein [Bacteroidota bacterium]